MCLGDPTTKDPIQPESAGGDGQIPFRRKSRGCSKV